MTSMLERPVHNNGVALTSHSSTTPTIREVWRTVPLTENLKLADPTRPRGDNGLKRKLRAMNMLGMGYFFSFSTLLLLVASKVTLPTIYTDFDILFCRKLLLYYMYGNMMLNYILAAVYGRNCSKKSEKDVLPVLNPSYSKSFCHTCQATIVPRAKHCSVCDMCVLKRDHHCFFTGCCIGFHNQRYFAVFCIYASVASLFCLYSSVEFLKITYVDCFSLEVYRMLLPWCIVEWLFGDLSFVTVVMVFLSYFTLVTLIACCWFGGYQFLLIYRGQTMYEHYRGLKLYRTTPADHFKSVFGPFWALNLIFPVPCLKNTDSGKNWNTLKHI